MGSRVTLVANTAPALNDVTAAETRDLLDEVAGTDVAVANATADGRLAVSGSGGTAPLLDLTQLTGECVDAIADADLIILHGMGRAIESNFRATFSCDSLRVAVLKDAAVAKCVGGNLFDCVFRLESAG
jgi:type II pantothenate kinase